VPWKISYMSVEYLMLKSSIVSMIYHFLFSLLITIVSALEPDAHACKNHFDIALIWEDKINL
jgi:hypothetical protein